MGKMHFNCYQACEGAQIVAICDADEKRLKDSGGMAGNIEGADKALDLTGIELYSDFDRMLAEANLDAVSITLPTFLHNNFSSRALKAGVNVLCEKPMGLNLADCDSMIEAAQQSGKVLQIGQCIRFWPEYAHVKEIIDSGQYGKVMAMTLRRLTAAPTWGHENWIQNIERSGGVELDLHIHDTDFVQYVFGSPKAVSSFGAMRPQGGLAHLTTYYHYEDGQMISAEGGWMMKPGFGFEMSFNVVMEGATIMFDCSRDPSYKICLDNGEVLTPKMEIDNGYVPQIKHFVQSVRGEKVPPVVTLESSRNSVRIVEAERESIRTGQRVALD
ncbi:MAG: Gfo/Idh/MocA family oxidoreductase [Candidatus Omnitrophica bacterium]|nr:Gfo/Idh/MocA family oxidoreductase [Candidatus Omnitrophota bacterium]